MNADVLLEHFHRLGDAPDAVPRLRRFILDLAVRGKLVDQDPKDESASSLLKKIAKEKAAYPTGRKKAFSAEPLAEEELRFALPSSWSWARTDDVTVYVQRGKSPKYSLEKKIPVIAQKCVQWVGFQLEKAQFIEPSSLAAYGEERHVQDGDLLWNSTGHGSLGRLIVFKERFKGKYPIIVADSHVTVIRPSKHINPDYLFCWFAGPLVQDEINDKSTGTTNQTELPVGTVMAYDVPLPPLPEQHRIVAKVDELMALCDRLEAAQQVREQRRTRLTAASWQALTSESDPNAARFALEQLPTLTTRPQQIAALRQTILDLAVRGRLVKQDEKDEPVEAKGDSKKGKSLPPVSTEDTLFDAPTSWKWFRLGGIAQFLNGDRGKNYPNKSEYVASGLAWINTGHIRPDGSLSMSGMHYITRKKFDTLRGGKIEADDLVYCLRGATLGKTAFVEPFTEGAVASSLVIIRINPALADKRFVYRYLMSSFGRDQIWTFDNGSAQPNLSANNVKLYAISLPPLAEQRRIVAKVDELMRLCDALEAALVASEGVKGRLLEAVLASGSEDQTIRPPMRIGADNGMRASPGGQRLAAKVVRGGGEVKAPRVYVEAVEELPMAAEPEQSEPVRKPRSVTYAPLEEHIYSGSGPFPPNAQLTGQVPVEYTVKRRPGRPRKSNFVALDKAIHTIRDYLNTHPGWHGKAAILQATGVEASAWNEAVKLMLDMGVVEREGEKKGARYRGVSSHKE